MYYTKYRPQKFSELSKPNDVAKALSTQIKNGNIVHAYLFVGSRGTGKTTMARLLAKALNCQQLESDGDPCGACDNCLAVQHGSFLDLIEIDAASNRGIDDIRELKQKIKLAPSFGKNKVYIIDEVHMLTPEAFNALLKTLEEPPKRVTFILCTTEFHKVPETIRSRCQVFKFKRATLSQLTIRLRGIADEEKAEITEQSLRMIASAAQGGFRDAETLLQQVIEGEIEVESLVNLGTRESYAEFVQLLFENNVQSALRVVSRLHEDGVDLYVWLSELLKYLRDLMYLQAGSSENIVDETDSVRGMMTTQAGQRSPIQLAKILNFVIDAQNKTKDTVIVQLPLEIAVVEICNMGNALAGSDVGTGNFPSAPSAAPKGDYFKIGHNPNEVEKSDDSGDEGVIGETVTVTVEHTVTEETVVTTEVSSGSVVSVEEISSQWKTVIKEVAGINNTISALLKSAKVAQVEGDTLILEVPYDFHKERLHSRKNKDIVEMTIESVVKCRLQIKCEVKKQPRPVFQDKTTGTLTDYNVVVPTNMAVPELSEDMLEVFDGGLPF